MFIYCPCKICELDDLGVFEEAQIRLVYIQKRMNRVCQAGEALAKMSSDKTAKTKFRMMYITVPKLLEEFETQFTVIVNYFT